MSFRVSILGVYELGIAIAMPQSGRML